MGLSTTYTKAETDFLLQQINKKVVEGYKGDLRISDPAPTEIGYYILLDVGTYTNLGSLNTVLNKLNFASFDGATWSLIVVDVPIQDYINKNDLDYYIGKNKFNKNKTNNGFLNNLGVVESPSTVETSLYCHFKVFLNKNQQYYGQGLNLNPSNIAGSYGMRFVTFYNENDTLLSGLNGWRTTFITPEVESFSYAIITILKTNKDSFQLEEGNIKTDYEDYFERLKGIKGIELFSSAYTKQESDQIFDKSETIDYTIESSNIADISKAQEGLIVQSVLNNGFGYSPSLTNWYGLWFALEQGQTSLAIQGWNTNRNEIFFGKGEVPTNGTEILQTNTVMPEVLVTSGHTNSLGYGNKSNGKIIISIPQGATWFGITLKSATDTDNSVFSNFMINYGNVFEEYQPYPYPNELVTIINNKHIGAKALINDAGEKFEISDFILKGNDDRDLMKISLFVDNSQVTSLEYMFNNKYIKQTLKPFRNLSNTTSQCFEFADMFIDNIQVGKTTDDGTPLRIGGYTVGANHGWAKMVYSFSVNHGKSLVDIGSIWNASGKELVLINVPNSTTLEFTSRNDNSTTTVIQLTHVSGATNTSTINANSVVISGLLFPSIKNLVKRVFLDGKEIKLNENKILYGKEITFSESYEILDKNSMIEDLITRVGTITTSPTIFNGQPIVQVNNSYVFDMNLGCTEYQDVIGLKDGTALQDLMFLQAQFNNIDTPIKYYIPNTKPIPYNGVNYDFTQPVDMSNFVFNSDSDNINFTPNYVEENGVYADRVIRLHNSIGVAFGFVQTRSGSKDVRRNLASRKALQIRGTKKIYMSLVDSSNITTINKGDYYSAISYRKYFEKDNNRIAYYIVDTNEGSYLYADYSELTMDRLMLPSHLVGKKFEIVDKSETIEVLSNYATDGITVSVNSKGYLILHFS